MSEGHDKAMLAYKPLLLLDKHLAMHVRVASAPVISCDGTSLHTSTSPSQPARHKDISCL